MKKAWSILMLSVGSVFFAFGAFAIYMATTFGGKLDSMQLQIAIAVAGIIFMVMGIRNIYSTSPKQSA